MVGIAATALQCSQGMHTAAVADALLGQPRRAELLPLQGRSLPCHRLPGSRGVEPLPIWPRLLEAVSDALAQARLSPALLEETGLFYGTSSHELAEDEQALRRTGHVALQGRHQGDPARRLAEYFSLGGGAYTLSTACTSSANALLLAAEAIQDGACRAAVVVGEESLNQTTLLGFESMLLLSGDDCRPFDRARNGMVPGEGLAVVVLVADGCLPGHSGPRWRGGASACDPQGITCSSAEAMAAVMQQALQQSGLEPGDIALLKAHGSASQNNDAIEAAAMHQVFGTSLPPVTALKGALGHSFGANGLVETVALLACLQRGMVPPAHGFAEPDVALDCRPLQQPGGFSGGAVMFNQFGFGGNNTSLILELVP